jgi:hypothetical protein
MKAIHERRMSKLNAHQERTPAHQESTETEPDPEIMLSAEMHQAIPNEDATVLSVGEPRKRHRVQNVATESRQKSKKRTWRNHGSWKELAAACRKVSCHAEVAW